MGLFDAFRRRKERGLFESAEFAEPRAERDLRGGSAVSITVSNSELQSLDEISDPALREQIAGALRLAGIDAAATGPGLTALPGGGLAIPPPSGDLVADLARLAELRSSGALTDEEFAAAKARLLGSQPPPSEPPSAA